MFIFFVEMCSKDLISRQYMQTAGFGVVKQKFEILVSETSLINDIQKG